MDPRISFVTLAAGDLAATRAFYVDGLGWTPELDVPGEVVMIRAGDRLVLSLWAETGFEQEVGPVRRGPGVARSPWPTTCRPARRSTRCSPRRGAPAPP